MIILLKRIDNGNVGDLESVLVRAGSPQEAMELAASQVPLREVNIWRSPSQIQSFMIEPEGASGVLVAIKTI